MTPTSLGVAGFTPAEGDPSSQSFTFTSDASGQSASFRQFMSSYAQSQQESEAPASPANRATEPERDADAEAADASTPQSGAPFTRSFDTGHQEQADQERSAAQTSPAGAGTVAAGQLSSAVTANSLSAAAPFAGLSPMQLLLNGGSLSQILAAANAANPSANATTANAASGPSRASVPALSGAVTAEKPKSSRGARDPKAPADASHLERLETGNSFATSGQPASAGVGSNPGDAQKSPEETMEALGGAAGALHTAGAEKAAEAGKAAATNFAFAARLTSDGAQAPAARAQAGRQSAETPGLAVEPPHALTVPAGAGLTEATVEAAAKTGEHHDEAPNDAAMLFADGHATAGRTEEGQASSEPDAPTAAAGAETDPTAAASEPVRNIRLQLDGDNNQRVDIRLVDIGGEMRVSVRAGDTRLAQTLQEHIPDLANRLDGQHVRAEIWTPRSESPSSSNQSNTSGQPSRGGSESSGRDAERRHGNGRQNGQQQKQPDWVDEFENYSSPTQTLRSNQIWPQ